MGIEHLLLLAIYLLMASEQVDGELLHEEHKTQAATRKPNNLSCYVCEMLEDGPTCLNMSKIETRWKRKCSEGQTMCMVKRFSYTTSTAENATSVVVSIERNCSSHCEPGCIVIRTKLSVCTSCCDKPYCNWVSKAMVSIEPSSYLLSAIIAVAVIVSLPP